MIERISIPSHSKFPDVTVLPQVYDEALSYYEAISYLMGKINECIDMVQNIELDSQGYTDETVANLRRYVVEMNNAIYSYVDLETDALELRVGQRIDVVDVDLQTKYLVLIGKIETVQGNLDLKSAELVGYMYKVESNLKAWVEFEIIKVRDYIDNSLNENIMVMNPTKGYKTILSSVMTDLWDTLRYFSISASDYDALEISADRYDTLNLTALDYDLYAGRTMSKNTELYMSNPITGEQSYYRDVINMLADFHKDNPLTASEYDALQITATQYDVFNISAKAYDFTGKAILV